MCIRDRRRIIHSAISEMEELSSESTGEGADRRVVVRSTGPNALPDKPRAPRGDRYGRGGSGKGGPRTGGRDRDRGPRRELRERPPRPQDVYKSQASRPHTACWR